MLRPNTWALTALIAFGYSSAALGQARGPSGSVCWPVDCDGRAPVRPWGTRPHAGPAFPQWGTCWSGVSLPEKGAPFAGTTPRPPPPSFSHCRPQCGVTGGRVCTPSAVAEMGVPAQPQRRVRRRRKTWVSRIWQLGFRAGALPYREPGNAPRLPPAPLTWHGRPSLLT